MAATVRQVIALAEELSEEDRRVLVDAITPKEANQEIARAWLAEVERRAARVRAGASQGEPAEDVFARIEGKLTGEVVRVLAFMHPRQRPGYWRLRRG